MKKIKPHTFRIAFLPLVFCFIQILIYPNESWAQNKASNPDPANGAIICTNWVEITWAPVETAASYHVYFGDDNTTVTNGTVSDDTFMGNQTATSFTVGRPDHPYPDGLAPGTYYWRIDVVDAADKVDKGDVWSFIVQTGKIIYVDPNASGANDGSRWTDAFNYLQDALAAATACDEIWVAEGQYRPDQNTTNPDGTQDRTATFQLKDNIQLYGGFAGTEVIRFLRDWEAHETILTGEIGDQYDTFDNCHNVVSSSGTSRATVLDGFTVTRGGIGMRNELGSPTVRNCLFCDNRSSHVGGMYNKQGSPEVTYCTFSENWAGAGGGICNDGQSSARIVHCTFHENFAHTFGGGMYNNMGSNPEVIGCTFSGNMTDSFGGGMCNMEQSHPQIINCVFIENVSEYVGGGMCNHTDCDPQISGCTFIDNQANGFGGGGIFSSGGNQKIIDCVFIGNRTENNGGGINNTYDSTLEVIGCQLIGNHAWDGGGIYIAGGQVTSQNCSFSRNFAIEKGGAIRDVNCISVHVNSTFASNGAEKGGALFSSEGTMELANCILWHNFTDTLIPAGSQISLDEDASLTPRFCNIEFGFAGIEVGYRSRVFWGDGVIDTDPLFASLGYWNPNETPGYPDDDYWVEGDFHLKSRAGRWDQESRTWVVDAVSSPCIDAGDPGMPVGDEPALNGGRINMGCYGGTAKASKSE